MTTSSTVTATMKWIHVATIHTAFLVDTNRAIYRAMESIDSEAVLLMQGQLFQLGQFSEMC